MIDDEGSLYSYELSALSLVAKAKASAVWGPGRDKPKQLSWDQILDAAYSKVGEEIKKGLPGGIVSGVVSVLLDRTLGPDKWEQSVTEQLKEVIAKLDQILDEIRALRGFITEHERQTWREILRARITGGISILERYLPAIREDGTMEGLTSTILGTALAQLEQDLEEVSNRRELETNRPLGIPLYAAVQASVLLIASVQYLTRVDRKSTLQLLNDYESLLTLWSSTLNDPLAARIKASSAEAAFLQSIPKRGHITTTGPNFASVTAPTDHRVMAVFVVIEGGLDAPFKFVRLEHGNVYDKARPEEHAKWVNESNSSGTFPLEVFPLRLLAIPPLSVGNVNNNHYPSHAEIVAGAHEMCNKLNSRRNALLDSVEETRKLQEAQASIASGAERLNRFALTI